MKKYNAFGFIYWIIYLKPPTNKTRNHEKIHLKQQKEGLYIGFFLIYWLDMLIKLIYYRNWSKAYKNNIYEREAYKNSNNPLYMSHIKIKYKEIHLYGTI